MYLGGHSLRCKQSFGNSKRFCSGAVSKPTIGFIGLGNMGSRMATNLYEAGFPLVINDTNTAVTEKFKKLSPDTIQVASTPKEVASKVTHIITMLPSSPHVKDVFTNPDTGIFASLRSNSFCIDSSTISPDVSREINALAEKKDSHFVDAPVSGGVLAAEKGTLTFMVGGTEANFQTAKSILGFMGRKIIHCGPSGNGEVAKLCNNLALAIQMIGTSEAMNLGQVLGMDPKILASIFNSSTARCWSSDSYNPVPGIMEGVPSSREYQGGFGIDLMLKDLNLALEAADSRKTALFITKDARAAYNLMSSQGFGNLDFSYVYKYLEERNHPPLPYTPYEF